MADVNFIDFHTDLDEALTERTSPQINLYEVRGIQLLPNNIYPYIQITDVHGGINLEDWTAYIVNTWDLSETDITPYFIVENVFTDENGYDQFTWSLTNVPYDFGNRMVYIKVVQTIGETFYSNMFQFTNNNSERTARIDYRGFDNETMQSVQLKMWYWQTLKNQELSNYYETSTRNTVTNLVKSQRYENWLTDIISNSLFLNISDVFEYKYVYLGLYRCNLFENIEIKEHSGTQNYAQNKLKIAFNKSDVYNPLMASIPVVDPLVPSITLLSVVTNGLNAIYTFTYANFIPEYLTYDYSADQVTWTSNTNATTSPHSISFNGTGTWYFRIRHPEAISNVITLNLGNTVIAVDDSIQVEKGATIDISTLLNDILVGTTTIISVSIPINGTATIIDSGRKIRYVHNDSATTSDLFTYTISNGITSDTATVNMTIVSSGTSTSFMMSSYEATQEKACVRTLTLTKYHNGSSLYPTINDYIFNDAALTDSFIGTEGFFAIYGGKWIQIDDFGKVIDKGFC